MSDASYIAVSVCITTFQMERYISRALKCVLSQRVNFNYEIIVSDDGSTDDTLKIVEAFQQENSHISILMSAENKGISVNMSKAILQARGKYIALLDADDYWIDDQKLQLQTDLMEQQPDAVYCFTNYYHENEKTGKRFCAFAPDYIFDAVKAYENMMLQHFIQPSNTIFRRDKLTNETIHRYVAEELKPLDYAIFLGLSLMGPGLYLDRITTIYNHRFDSMSRRDGFYKKLDYFNNCNRVTDFFNVQRPLTRQQNRKRLFDHELKLLLTSWEHNQQENAAAIAVKQSMADYLKFKPRALYLFFASRHAILFRLFGPWVLRNRK